VENILGTGLPISKGLPLGVAGILPGKDWKVRKITAFNLQFPWGYEKQCLHDFAVKIIIKTVNYKSLIQDGPDRCAKEIGVVRKGRERAKKLSSFRQQKGGH